MEVDFENALIGAFERLEHKRFKVNFAKKHIFVCGGLVDVKSQIPPSFRDRFIQYTATNYEEINQSIVLAESFKDYFKENIFSDLLVFEDEIASVASLILIFLESPGSLVELGMFCSRPGFYKKLLIVAPQEQTESEDSFIYLGPLEHIRRKEENSVVIYPWPSNEKVEYNIEYLNDLLGHVSDKLNMASHQVAFVYENSGHVALLVYEIIRLSYPILIGEIELALCALNLDIKEAEVRRHLYILSKLGMISHNFYSNYTYYYPMLRELKTINFGRDKEDKILDALSIQMSINQSYIMEETGSARKRRAAKTQINEKLKGGSK